MARPDPAAADPFFRVLRERRAGPRPRRSVACGELPHRRTRGLAQPRSRAVHLKLVALAWAADHGVSEVYTWTQDGNAAMGALNTRLGYATTRVGVQLSRQTRSA